MFSTLPRKRLRGTSTTSSGSDTKLGVIVADVSGKGIAASLRY